MKNKIATKQGKKEEENGQRNGQLNTHLHGESIEYSILFVVA